MKVTFVFSQPKDQFLEKLAAGHAPDSGLLGQNHLPDLGIETGVYTPVLSRRNWRSARNARLAWYLRELTLPFELGDSDVVCTPLCRAYPLVERRRRVFILNEGLCNTLSRPFRYRRLVTASVRASEGVICFSEANREQLIAQTGLSPDRVHAIPISVDDRFFTPSSNGTGDYVLTVGFDIARDYSTFLEAMKGLPYKTIMVARPRSVKGATLPSNVELEPDASYVRLRELYAGARCVVLPVKPDSFPYGGDTSGATALAEAMAMAKPIVTTERKHWSDYVVDGESALVVPPEDPQALREAIQETFENESLGESLGQAALKTARERLSSRRFAEQLARIVSPATPGS